MTHPHSAHPGQPDPLAGADVVPGDPPVPVNIWRLPPGEDTPVGARLAARLIAEYTRAQDLIYDTLPSPLLRKAAHAAGRGYRATSRFQAPNDRAALAVTTWPLADQQLDPVIVLGGLRRRLRPGGFLAVIVTNPAPEDGDQTPVELGPLVQAATAGGLSYLQHIVTMSRPPGDPGDPAPPASSGGFHERAHGDLLVLRRLPGTGGADA